MTKFNYIFERIKLPNYESENPLRTERVECMLYGDIIIGKRVSLFAESLTEGCNVRYISTSEVSKINTISDTIVEFETESGSKYRLTKVK